MKICQFPKRTKPGQNIDMSWPEFVQRIMSPVVTYETSAEYAKMPKSEQSEIKDVGGFVGGLARDGRRTKESIEYRELISLDMDFAPKDYVQKIDNFLSPYRYLVYPTHKYRQDSPRVRIVIPLSRPVTPEEYEPVARFVASEIDIESFDDTTYQYERLMYWPSIPRDVSYNAYESTGQNLLDPDLVLSLYDDWHDISQWPVSQRQTKIIKRISAKQKDPLEKDGIVGAFCREYSIEEVIVAYLSDVYTPLGAGRYTFRGGTTVGGLVVYDDKFAYSHHSTDPACGMCCNAFDLVRVHKFDANEDDETKPANRRKSYQDMENLALSDLRVKTRLITERQRRAEEDFSAELAAGEDWTQKLAVSKKGDVLSTAPNVQIILENDPRFKGHIGGMDEMRGMPYKFDPMPWDDPSNWNRLWTDADDAGLRILLEGEYGISGLKKVEDALCRVFDNHKYHPIRDYLNSLKWDGIKRVETFFSDFLGVEDNEYSRFATRKFFTAAVARVMEPGCKWDYMPMLVGGQGLGKSRLIRELFGADYTNDSLKNLNGKNAYEALEGTWVLEMAEMTLFRKTDIESMKQYITSPADKYRRAYGKRVDVVPRQCVFIGTTNEDDCLKDYTGNRRFWPLKCSDDINREFVLPDDMRDQLWAEAAVLYSTGEKLYPSPHEEVLAEEARKNYTFIPDRWISIQNYLDRMIPSNWYDMNITDRILWLNSHSELDGDMYRDRICAKEIWRECYGRADREFSNSDQRDIKSALAYLGWKRAEALVPIKGYGRQRGFVRDPGKRD